LEPHEKISRLLSKYAKLHGLGRFNEALRYFDKAIEIAKEIDAEK